MTKQFDIIEIDFDRPVQELTEWEINQRLIMLRAEQQRIANTWGQ